MNKRVVGGHDAERGQVVPAEAHGDEHEVRVIFLVPLRASEGREQHKPNLVGHTEKTLVISCLLPVVPKGIRTAFPRPALAGKDVLHRKMAGLILVLAKAYFQPNFRGTVEQVEPLDGISTSTRAGRWGNS